MRNIITIKGITVIHSPDLVERDVRLKPSDNSVQFNYKEATFFLYDHLGNTRVSYSKLDNGLIVHSLTDYFPYGKILREYISTRPRYLTTQHERDTETDLDYRGARYYDSEYGRFLSVDPLANKFPSWSTYNYVMGNPIILIDPSGKSAQSTDVRKNKNGSFTVVNAVNDSDNGVYVVDDEGKRTGEKIGYTTQPYDFMSTNNKTGEFYFNKDETGVTFDLNNLTVSGTVSPREGMKNTIYNADGNKLLKWAEGVFKQELDERGIVDPYSALNVLKSLSANGEALDLKVSLGADPYTALQFGTVNGKPRITTLRGIGNMAFGSNFESIYSQATCAVNKRQYYDLVMGKVGEYNQSQNKGNGYNSGYPYFGEHDYSGSYIYYGFWSFFNTKK